MSQGPVLGTLPRIAAIMALCSLVRESENVMMMVPGTARLLNAEVRK